MPGFRSQVPPLGAGRGILLADTVVNEGWDARQGLRSRTARVTCSPGRQPLSANGPELPPWAVLLFCARHGHSSRSGWLLRIRPPIVGTGAFDEPVAAPPLHQTGVGKPSVSKPDHRREICGYHPSADEARSRSCLATDPRKGRVMPMYPPARRFEMQRLETEREFRLRSDIWPARARAGANRPEPTVAPQHGATSQDVRRAQPGCHVPQIQGAYGT